MRKCQKCKKEKSLTEFYRNKSKPQGRTYVCKQCDKETSNERYRKKRERNPITYYQKDRRYYLKHKKEIADKLKKWYHKNRNKILAYLIPRSKITNSEIEKLLQVSDATATRYLDELEKEGRIRQIGRAGRSTHYEKI